MITPPPVKKLGYATAKVKDWFWGLSCHHLCQCPSSILPYIAVPFLSPGKNHVHHLTSINNVLKTITSVLSMEFMLKLSIALSSEMPKGMQQKAPPKP
jgi:hypothetical protein